MADLFGGAIDDYDLLQFRHVDVDVRPLLFQLKRLRLTAQLVLFVEALVGGRIDHGDRSSLFIVAATNIDTSGHHIVA